MLFYAKIYLYQQITQLWYEVGEDRVEKDLYQIVKGCQQNDESCFSEIYNRFLPLLKKYSSGFYDKDDAFDALYYSFIICLYKMPLNNEQFKHNGVIVSYICTTVRNQYYALCIEKAKKHNVICSYEELDIEQADKTIKEDDELLLFSLKQVLKEEEVNLVKLKYILKYSDVEIAKMKGISRQAVNKKVRNLVGKMKKLHKEGMIL